MKSSVLIANYNNANHLEDCFNSILSQTFDNIEIIFIDDSSTDNSLEIFDKFKHKIIQVKKKIPKTGIQGFDQTLSFLECLKVSSGDIIHFCDSDDYFKKNKIKIIIDEFLKNEKYKLIFDLPILKYEKKLKFLKKKNKLLGNYWPYFPPTSCISIRKKQLLESIEILSEKNFPDITIDFRLGILSKYKFNEYNIIENNLTFYRQINSSISSNYIHLSRNWWLRRKQAHDYVKYFFDKNNFKYKKNIDYFITKLISKILE